MNVFRYLSVLAMGFIAISATGQRPSGIMWLDKQLSNWNNSTVGPPNSPKIGDVAPECMGGVRRASTAEDQVLTSTGWTLFGPQEKFGGTLVLKAMSSVDGMCRPLDYQVFVFVNGQFAGTLSPLPMNSRTDGAEISVHFSSEVTLNAEFQRYAPSDPMCCPSRIARVAYKIEKRNGRSILVPESVQTTPQ
jgi:hypothetical protein